jgi:hypothetical protein
MKKYIKVGEYYTELFNDEHLQEVFTVEFGGSYQLQISRIDGILKVTNGVDGWGKYCGDEFKDAEVKILCELLNSEQKVQVSDTSKA